MFEALRLMEEHGQDRAALARDPGWEAKASDWHTAVVEMLAPLTDERRADLRRMNYRAEYLRSPEWQVTRTLKIRTAGRECQRCGTYTRSPDVHHLTYERLGDELLDDLAVLCRSCHEAIHADTNDQA